ncbi:MAG: transcription antitermination factor NusB [Acidobacteriota bacterium]
MSRFDARRLALDVLLRVEEGAASDRALDRALRRSGFAADDRGLATELVYGVLRRRAGIDRLLAPHSKRPLASLDAPALNALRLGAYQIEYLDRIPAHAAVDASVEAVKAHTRSAAGFVNAVLRALLRARSGRADGSADPWSEVPGWWAERWRQRYGDAGGAWLAATLEPAPLVMRPHPRIMPAPELVAALAEEGIDVEPEPVAPGALRVIAGQPTASPLLRRHAFALRGAASQLVAALLPVASGDRVLDACAGRGGKTLQVAEDHDAGLVVAADVSAWRAVACRREARAAGIAEVHAVVADMAQEAPFRRLFEAVLVDAPCSGLGTVRRRPELRWRNDPQRLARLAELQRAILSSAVEVTAPGGVLLYATCSTEPEENEQVVAAVLAAHDDLAARAIELPAGLDARLVGVDGFLRTYPTFPDMDGFFAALLVKSVL